VEPADVLAVEQAEREDLRADRVALLDALGEACEAIRLRISDIEDYARVLSPELGREVERRLAPVRRGIGSVPQPDTPCPIGERVADGNHTLTELLGRPPDDTADLEALQMEVDELAGALREANAFIWTDLTDLSDWMRSVAPEGTPHLGRLIDEATRLDVAAAWREAGQALGIEVVAPYSFETADGPLAALALLVGIGRPNGTLVFDLNTFFESDRLAIDGGFWPVGIHPSRYRTFDHALFAELVEEARNVDPDPQTVLVRISEPLCEIDPLEEMYDTEIHTDVQDTECAAWRLLLELIDEAAADGRERFDPKKAMPRSLWQQVLTLPPSIAKLTAIKDLHLYGSNLVALPPEIGAMTNLETFTPYTSRRLHWFPYEITRCAHLHASTVSTRHLYGNFKHRMPFPALPAALPPGSIPDTCSVCQGPFPPSGYIQVWVSLQVATDVLPLLVHACSAECVAALPDPPPDHVARPHRGGTSLRQPDPFPF